MERHARAALIFLTGCLLWCACAMLTVAYGCGDAYASRDTLATIRGAGL